MDKIGKYEFLAEPFHCDVSKRLFMGHLGNSMLNAADFHSSDRGFGMRYLNTIGKTWVLSRLAIEMAEMPQQYDRFSVETWVENCMRFFTNRNFRVVGSDGRVYGYGRSVWAMIDTSTRQPTDIFAINDGAIKQWIDDQKECPIAKGSRVKVGEQAMLQRTITTGYSDIDINGHVNSVKYIEHILDLWNVEWHAQHCVSRFEIAYVAEAHHGDALSFFVDQTAPTDFCVSIRKDGDIEVVRSHISFAPRDVEK